MATTSFRRSWGTKVRASDQWIVACSAALVQFVNLAILLSSCSCIDGAAAKSATAAGCRAAERQALLSFKDGFNDGGNLLATWMQGSDCCAGWAGITCDPAGHVVKLTLQAPPFDSGSPFVIKSGLSGNPGAFLGNLVELRDLQLSFVDFAGSSIPDEFGKLASLKTLQLQSTRFGGKLPKALGNLLKLQLLRIVDNSLPQPLPVELCELTQLKTVDLEINQLIGPLPSCLTSWSKLSTLILATNSLSGAFPSWIPDLYSLTSLDLRDNRFSGAIPSSISQLFDLQFLQLSNNLLSGGIPAALGSIEPLISLQLGSNAFSGTIPASLGNLPKLFMLDLSNNRLTGSIPRELGKLKSVRFLTLHSNRLSGPIPSELGNLQRGVTIDVSNNSLSGTIPSSLSNLLRGSFIADSNFLSGAFPVGLLNMDTVMLSNNRLSSMAPNSPLPTKDLINLSTLDLSFNLIPGSVPEWLSASVGLTELHLDNNHLSGGIPISLLALPQLRFLNLSNNPLQSVLPESASGSSVAILDLQSTGLHGQITSEFFSSFPMLAKLYLQNNQLSGELPPDIGSAAAFRLSAMDLSYNNLNGTVPTSIKKLKRLNLLDLSHNQFTGDVPHLP